MPKLKVQLVLFSTKFTQYFNRKNLSYEVAGIITQSLVDINDPAFNNPTKPIGSFILRRSSSSS